MDDIIRQREWKDEELRAAGFRHYRRKKEVVMARRLPPEEAPLVIETAWDTLVANAGYMICYDPGDIVWPKLEDYDHWPCEPTIFEHNYRPWDTKNWWPTPPEAQLLKLGCKPYYKVQGVWAQRLAQPVMVQSLESPTPTTVPAGAWLVIGADGDPYSMSERAFTRRYEGVEYMTLQQRIRWIANAVSSAFSSKRSENGR